MIISVTRLELRVWWYLPIFALYSAWVARSARRTPGNLGVRLRRTRGLVFWTQTAWQDDASLRSFVTGRAHTAVAPKLQKWASQAAFATWASEAEEFPDWETAASQLRHLGRMASLRHPDGLHAEGSVDIS